MLIGAVIGLVLGHVGRGVDGERCERGHSQRREHAERVNSHAGIGCRCQIHLNLTVHFLVSRDDLGGDTGLGNEHRRGVAHALSRQRDTHPAPSCGTAWGRRIERWLSCQAARLVDARRHRLTERSQQFRPRRVPDVELSAVAADRDCLAIRTERQGLHPVRLSWQRFARSQGVERPESHVAILGRRRKGISIRADRQPHDGRIVGECRSFEPGMLAVEPPHANRPVDTGGEHARAVGREDDRVKLGRRLRERRHALARGRVPELHGAIGRARCEHLAIGRKRQAVNRIAMVLERRPHAARGKVPQ